MIASKRLGIANIFAILLNIIRPITTLKDCFHIEGNTPCLSEELKVELKANVDILQNFLESM